MTCPCGSQQTYERCCGPLITGQIKASGAEALMRSRYSAYSRNNPEYILQTTHPDTREQYDLAHLQQWCNNVSWLSLEISTSPANSPADDRDEVCFLARYLEGNQLVTHGEHSHFHCLAGTWYFHHGEALQQACPATITVGRNQPCPCGSGKKFKRCHGK